MDIRQASGFTNWKTGVILKLYTFQLAQSNKQVALNGTMPWPMPQQEGIIVNNTTPDPNGREQLDLGDTMPDANAWEQLHLDMTQSGHDNALTRDPLPPRMEQEYACLTPTTNNEPTHKPMTTEMEPATGSKAKMFMQSRPGGQLDIMNRDMKGVERRVSSQLQKKCSTSTQGRNALVTIATTMANENKESETVAQHVNKRKKLREVAVLITPNKKYKRGVRHQAADKRKAVKSMPTINTKTMSKGTPCKYGCHHGGLVELLQMIPKHTKYHLESGNYFHQKSCKDCNESIRDLFEKSKSKGIYYYCHMDNKVADLRDDDQEKEASACACILCLPCYYLREEHKTLATGKSTRSSGRGRG